MKVTRQELIKMLLNEMESNHINETLRFEGNWKVFESKLLNRNVYFNEPEFVFDFQIENSPRFTNDEKFEISEPTIKENLTVQKDSTNEENSAVEKEEDETQTRNRPSYKTLCEEKDLEIQRLNGNIRVITDSNNTLNEWFVNATKEKEELQKKVDLLIEETDELAKERYRLAQENEKLTTKTKQHFSELKEEKFSGTFESIENEITLFMEKRKDNACTIAFVKTFGIVKIELDKLISEDDE